MSQPSQEGRSDQQLVADLNRGDLSAFDALYYRYRNWVVRLACRFTGSQDDALDVLQETFSYLFGKFPSFQLSAKMTTFLYPVVRNLSVATRKRRLRLRGEEELINPPAPAADSAGGRDDLEAVLRILPQTHREVLLMRFVDDMSLQEIGIALGIPEGTVKSRLHNGIQTLRNDPRVRKYFSMNEP